MKAWDSDKGGRDSWIKWMTTVSVECLRVIKPGGHALVWSIPRTSHWTTMAWEDAGWEVRDKVVHIFSQGFPKSLNISKQIDKHDGKQMSWFGKWLCKWRCENNITQKEIAILFPSKTGGLTGCVANWELGFNIPTIEQFNLIRDTFNLPFEYLEDIEREVVGQRRTGIGTGKGSTPIMGDGNRDITIPRTNEAKQFSGFGTALKPAHEDWILFRKPLEGTVAQNVLKWGVGGINIDGCRIESEPTMCHRPSTKNKNVYGTYNEKYDGMGRRYQNIGRFPANLIHDGSDEVLNIFPTTKSGKMMPTQIEQGYQKNTYGKRMEHVTMETYGDAGSAARFFYCAKSSPSDRGEGNTHPTVKSISLMRYLCRLITPPHGIILDPFAGSGSTGVAAKQEGFQSILIEKEKEYVDIANSRIRGMK